jgi:hypothetical protein
MPGETRPVRGAEVHTPGNIDGMARGDHPRRTPFYAVRLLMLAFGACAVASSTRPAWASAVIYTGAAAVAMVGFVMTFRDYG